MEKSISNFPFRKLRNRKFLALNMMMFVDRAEVLKFMFSLNIETRYFLHQHFKIIRNGFFNEGLFIYRFERLEFGKFLKLDNLYLQAINRNQENRIVTIDLCLYDFTLFNEVLAWIKAQNKHIEFRFKVTAVGE